MLLKSEECTTKRERERVKGINASSSQSPVVDEERMRSGHWLRLVVLFLSVLLLMVGDREEIRLINNAISLIPNFLFWNMWKSRTRRGTGRARFT